MKTKKKVSRIEFRNTPEQVEAFNSACKAADINASTVIRDLCDAVCPYIRGYCTSKPHGWRPPMMVPPEKPRWDIRHLQVVLDQAQSTDEIKDLVYTVLEQGWALTWDSPIGKDLPYLDELKAAVRARLKDLRKGSK